MPYLPEILIDRYKRFKFRHFTPNVEQYEALSEAGQSPNIMLISCCDSRVDPETIFSAMPGELFVVRNVANLIPPYETTGKFHGVSAALEYAALTLRVGHIVIMGHSKCGGIKACLDHGAAKQTEAQFIKNWMSMLDPARERVLADNVGAPPAQIVAALELEAIKQSLENLRTFPCIQILEGKGRIALHGCHFDIASGTLFMLNQATGEYVAA